MRTLLAMCALALMTAGAAGCDCGDDDDDSPRVPADDDDLPGDDDNSTDDDVSDDDTSDDDTSDDDADDDSDDDADDDSDDDSDDDADDDADDDIDDDADDDTGDLNEPTCEIDTPSGNFPGPWAPGDIDPLVVTITCTDDLDPTPTIHYTTDGSAPQVGGGSTTSVDSPAVVTVERSTTLRWYATDDAENESAFGTRNYGIWLWEDFEGYDPGDELGSPWFVAGDPWGGTIPTVEPRADPPGGMFLEMIDDNDSPDGPHDTYALATAEDPIPWPNEVLIRFEWGLSGGDGSRFFTYAAVGAVVYWQVILDMKNGDVLAWDNVPGAWIDCADVDEGDWYEFEIAFNHSADTYSVDIDGAATPCSGLQVLSVVSGLDEGVSVATFGDAGVTGTVMFDNVQISPP